MPNQLISWDRALSRLAPDLCPAIENRPRHVPCPVHRGKDGFRAFDDFDSSGGMVCNSCGSFPNGYLVLAWVLDISTQEAARLIRHSKKNLEFISERGIPVITSQRKQLVDVTAQLEIEARQWNLVCSYLTLRQRQRDGTYIIEGYAWQITLTAYDTLTHCLTTRVANLAIPR